MQMPLHIAYWARRVYAILCWFLSPTFFADANIYEIGVPVLRRRTDAARCFYRFDGHDDSFMPAGRVYLISARRSIPLSGSWRFTAHNARRRASTTSFIYHRAYRRSAGCAGHYFLPITLTQNSHMCLPLLPSLRILTKGSYIYLYYARLILSYTKIRLVMMFHCHSCRRCALYIATISMTQLRSNFLINRRWFRICRFDYALDFLQAFDASLIASLSIWFSLLIRLMLSFRLCCRQIRFYVTFDTLYTRSALLII